jgi:hypothetical protein
MFLNEEFLKLWEELSELNEDWSNSTRLKDKILSAYLRAESKEAFIDGLETAYKNGGFGKFHKTSLLRLQESIKVLKSGDTRTFPIISEIGWLPLAELLPKELANQKGCYIIKNKQTGQVYVGKATTFKNRIVAHAKAVDKDSGALHEAIKNHLDDFVWSILDIENNATKRDELESLYIGRSEFKESGKCLNTLYNIFDYNLVPGGEGGGASKLDLENQLGLMWRLYTDRPLNKSNIANDFGITDRSVTFTNEKIHAWVDTLISYLKAGKPEILDALATVTAGSDKNIIKKFISDIDNNETIHPITDKAEIALDKINSSVSDDVYMKCLRGWIVDNKYKVPKTNSENPLGNKLQEVNKLLNRPSEANYLSKDRTRIASHAFVADKYSQYFGARLSKYLKEIKAKNRVQELITLAKDCITKYCKKYPSSIEELRELPEIETIFDEFLQKSNLLKTGAESISPASHCTKPSTWPDASKLADILGVPEPVDLEKQFDEAQRTEATLDWGIVANKGVSGHGYSKDPNIKYDLIKNLALWFTEALKMLNEIEEV